MCGGEKKRGTTDKTRACELCVALTKQNSDWFFLRDLSTICQYAQVDVNTRENIALPVRGFISLTRRVDLCACSPT